MLSSRRSSTWLPKRLRPWNSQRSITASRWRAYTLTQSKEIAIRVPPRSRPRKWGVSRITG